MEKRRLTLALSSLTIALGGLAVNGAPATAELFLCNDRQITYVRDVIRAECGIWGGRAQVVCNGNDIEFVSIECN